MLISSAVHWLRLEFWYVVLCRDIFNRRYWQFEISLGIQRMLVSLFRTLGALAKLYYVIWFSM